VADVLKQTLFFAGNPTLSTTDFVGNGVTVFRTITAAESHDGSDATYYRFSTPSDIFGLGQGDVIAQVSRTIDSASVTGSISFLRMRARGKKHQVGGDGNVFGRWQPRINGTDRGSQQELGNEVFADFSQDFSTDPADGLAWTNAKVNAQTFGTTLEVITNAATADNQAEVWLSEWFVELWGPSSDTSTPASVVLTVSSSAPTGVLGLVTSAPQSVQLNVSSSAPTVVLGGVMSPVESVGMVAEVATLPYAFQKSGFDPTQNTPLASMLDTGVAPITIRSASATYNDQSLATATLQNHGPGGSGTDLKDLGGVQGAVAINGVGVIAGVKLYAIVRASKTGVAGSLTNFKFGTTMGVKALLAQPTVVDNTPGLTVDQYQTIESVLITTGAFGQPFEWGNGVNSVWATFVAPTWTLNYDWTGGTQVRVEIAEAWLVVQGPNGSQSEEVVLRQRFGNPVLRQSFPANISE
jgi:hypothetical protein